MEQRKTKTTLFIRMLAFLLCLLPCLVLPAMAEEALPVSEPVCYEHGDVNGDGNVDSRDAVYVLYHSFFEENPEYAVTQDCDFNNDGQLTSADAVYVLYSSFGGMLEQSHPLNGTVHQYYSPMWNWKEDGTAEVTLKCGCGREKILTKAEGVTVQKVKETVATCVDAGVAEYTAAVTYDGQAFSDTKQVVTPAVGHAMEGVRSCESASVCSVCGYTQEPLGHDWILVPEKSSEATCTAQAVQVYRCGHSGCDAEKTVTLEGYAEHSYALAETEQDGCRYQQILKCACGDQIEGTVYYEHTYTAELTREANCRTTGVKTFVCVCGDRYEESIPRNDSHDWVEAGTENGIITYSCACGETKTAVCAEGDTAAVTKEDLKAASEVQIQDVAVSLDEDVISNLGETVEIQITTTSAADLAVDEQAKQQIGSNPVYDITLLSDDDAVSELNGTATISVPYSLQDGDDVDCIDIWFIDDEGNVTCVKGTYSNGYVTFTTTHFSYYTVTRLTPKQRCETYGHAIGKSHTDATCTKEGYHKEICQRCGYVEADRVLEKAAHAYQETREGATCTEDGSFRKVCSSCGETISGTIPALGHSWEKDEERSVEASCTAAGKTVYVCGHDNCDATYTEDIPQLKHDYGDSQQTDADCDNHGHKKRVCKLCGHEEVFDQTAPTGHCYLEENAVWTWSDDYSRATVTLVCSYNKNHTKTLNAVISSKLEGNACQGTGVLTYTAKASFNKYTYTDVQTVAQEKVEHQPEEKWTSNAAGHSRKCKVCGDPIDAGSHVWGQQIVEKAATCSEAGKAKQSCGVCGYTREVVLEATREHDYVNGICKDCGFAENSCSHIRTHKTPLDLSDYDVCEGADIRWVSCDCGEVKYLYTQALYCNMEYSEREEVLPNGDTRIVSVSSCQDCGLSTEYSWNQMLNEVDCTTVEVETLRVIVHGEQIAVGRRVWTEGEGSGQHIINVPAEEIDLSQYGDLCGVILEKNSCYCGERTATWIRESQCRWVHDEAQSTDTVEVFRCKNCNAVRKSIETDVTEAENCQTIHNFKTVFEVDGREIYSFTNQEIWTEHDYDLAECEMDGDSCLDGVYVKQICRDCGKVYEWYTDFHATIRQTETKLEGFCCDRLIQTVCACGANKSCYLMWFGNSHCSWYHPDDETRQCTVCGLTESQSSTAGKKNEKCEVLETTAYVYKDKNGKTVATGERVFSTTEHDFDSTRELLGQSCEDGVKVSQICKDCGYTERYTTHSHQQIHTTYDLAEYGLCGGKLITYSCACGRQSGYSNSNRKCDWEHISGKDGKIVEFCPACGVTRTTVEEAPEAVGSCWLRYGMTITYTKEQKILLEVKASRTRDNHRSVYKLTPFGSDCTDGYQIEEKCLTCGETDTWESYPDECGTWAVAREWLSQGTLCGDLEMVTYRCACGQIEEKNAVWHGGECSFGEEIWLGEGKGHVATCSQCGVTKNYTDEYGKIPGTCRYENIWNVTFSKNGSELFRYQDRDVHWSHDYISAFRLSGDTCADGFEVKDTCFDCGKTRTRTYSDADCNHGFTVGKEILHDGDGICGAITKVISGCACGQDREISIQDNCDWEYVNSRDNTSYYVCLDCGLEQSTWNMDTETPGSCDVLREYAYTYTKDDVELLKQEFSFTSERHEYLATFEMLGDSCEDGYYVTEICARCGHQDPGRGFGTEHGTWQTEYHDLCDYGMCGGEIWRSSCACGMTSDWNYNEDCNWDYVGEDSATGLSQYYCSKCRIYRILGSVGSTEKNSCDWKGTFYAVLTRDGENLLNLQKPVSRKNHKYVMEDVILHDPAQGCEGGYRATMQCSYCDASYTTSGYDHEFHETEYVALEDLYEKICADGSVTLERCACGDYSRVEWNKAGCSTSWNSNSYEGTDGYTHHVETRICKDCGFTWTEDYYLERTPGVCLGYRIGTVTLSAGGQTLKTWNTRTRQYEHTTDRTYSLLSASSSCEDGLWVTETCRLCDYVNTWTYSDGEYNHSNYNLDAENSIDLTQYGSVCGGTLARYVCACGKQQRYDFTPETLCDIDRQYISHWIPGTIDTYQYTSEGYVWTDSASYLMVCAVTDPDCGLKIRMSEYWLEKNCVATEYQTWQLGYDDLTGTCAYEFTIETGDRHAYHTYKTSESTAAEGDLKVNIHEQRCSKCDSTYTEKDYYNQSDSHVKAEEIAVNTLDNGENKQFIRLYKYDRLFAGYRYQTLDRYDVTRADGSTYWEQSEYVYNFANGCHRTRTYTNSDGKYQVWDQDAHLQSWHVETIQKPTCTQYGEYWDIYSCKVCQQEYQRNKYQQSPTAHNWCWNNDKQFYVCQDCGLENINGASGEIVLEDMTDSYGAGENYVVGYWNRGAVDALRYVSVVLKDAAEGENDELVLTDIDFTYLTRNEDGITAIRFSQAAVQSSAEKAVADAGYTGSYVIRFTFVPKYAEDTLDYAITFDDLIV